MATRVPKKRRKAAAPKGAAAVRSAAKDLEILHPDREVAIAGRVVTVREYGFLDGMRLQAVAKPFFDALYGGIPQGGGAPRFEEVQDLLPHHLDLVTWMVAVSLTEPGDDPAQRDADIEQNRLWVEKLAYADGQRLMDLWWMANSGFFIQLVFRRMGMRSATPQAGHTSTSPSSETGSDEHQTTSGDSPSAR